MGSRYIVETTEDGTTTITAPPNDDSDGLLEALHTRAKEQFPEEYERILKKWGTVEVISIGGQVEGVAEPEEYIRHGDKRAERLGQRGPNREVDGPTIAVTSAALRRVAEGQLAQAIAEWESIRTEPEALYNEVVRNAQTAGETLPDQEGNASTPEDLLSDPRYVTQRFKYLVHNTLLEVGSWSAVCEYLRDIERLDETEGRLGAVETRRGLMSQVRNLMDQRLERQLKFFTRGASRVPHWRPYFTRVQSYGDYGGAEFAFDGSDYPNIEENLRQRNLSGAMVRLFLQPVLGTPRQDTVKDISNALANTGPEDELPELALELRDVWAEIALTQEIIDMLGVQGSDWDIVPSDERLLKNASDNQKSISICEGVVFETHITSAESLKSPSVFSELWQELDDASLRIAQTTIDKVVAFAQVIPSWTHPDVPPPSHIDDQLELQLSAVTISQQEEPPLVPSVEVEARPDVTTPTDEFPLASTSDISSSRAAPKLQPVSYLSQRATSSFPEPPAPRQGPKVKTRGEAHPPQVDSDADDDDDEVAVRGIDENGKLVYFVGPKVYGTFERLLDTNDAPMAWSDLDKALAKMRFSKIPRHGTRTFTFDPPPEANATSDFPITQIGREILRVDVRKHGKRLYAQYRWTIGMFSPERAPPTQMQGVNTASRYNMS